MIVTDSLGAPRHVGERTEFKQTWPYLLKNWMIQKFNYDNFVLTQNGLDTDELLEITKQKLTLYDQEYIFLQVGIVDCSRRVIGKNFGKFIFSIPILRYVVRSVARKFHYQFTSLYKVTYVNEKKFRKNIEDVVQSFENNKVIICVPILPVGPVMKKKSYNIDFQINKYNLILKNISLQFKKFVYMENITHSFVTKFDEGNFLADGYHLSSQGHKVLFENLASYLQNDFKRIDDT